MNTAPDAGHSARLLIGTDDRIQSIVRSALDLQGASPATMLLVLVGADARFSFKPRPSTILIPGMPEGVIACVPQLDEFGVASRLASPLGLPGCHDGPVVELAELWLTAYVSQQPTVTMEILVSATEETTRGVADLGQRLRLPVRVIAGQETSP